MEFDFDFWKKLVRLEFYWTIKNGRRMHVFMNCSRIWMEVKVVLIFVRRCLPVSKVKKKSVELKNIFPENFFKIFVRVYHVA